MAFPSNGGKSIDYALDVVELTDEVRCVVLQCGRAHPLPAQFRCKSFSHLQQILESAFAFQTNGEREFQVSIFLGVALGMAGLRPMDYGS